MGRLSKFGEYFPDTEVEYHPEATGVLPAHWLGAAGWPFVQKEPTGFEVVPTTGTIPSSIVVWYDDPVRPSHFSIRADTYWVKTTSISWTSVWVEYSQDNEHWVRIPTPMPLAAQLVRGSNPMDYLWLYLAVVPTTREAARYWKIQPKEGDFFSDWHDLEWHTDSVAAGEAHTMIPPDKKEIRYSGYRNEAVSPSGTDADTDKSWSVPFAGRVFGQDTEYLLVGDTGILFCPLQSDVLSTAKGTYASGGIDTFSRNSVYVKVPAGVVTGGSSTGVGTLEGGRSSVTYYSRPTLPSGLPYTGVALLESPEAGCAMVPVFRGGGAVGVDGKTRVPNKLGGVPDHLFVLELNLDGSAGKSIIAGATPNDMTRVIGEYPESTVEYTDEFLLFSEDWTTMGEGVLIVTIKDSAPYIESGTYIGDGTTDRDIPLSIVRRPKILLSHASQSGGYWAEKTENPLSSPSHTLNFDSFRLETTAFNSNGTEYHWWVLG